MRNYVGERGETRGGQEVERGSVWVRVDVGGRLKFKLVIGPLRLRHRSRCDVEHMEG